MMDYLYDSTFDGFLTCIYFHYYEDKATGIYPAGQYQRQMLNPYRIVSSDPEKAQRVYEAIEEKIFPQALERVYEVFLSSVPEKENIALNYIRLGFKYGAGLNSLHSHPIVHAAQQAQKKVRGEAHKLCGLVRFSVLSAEKDGQKAELLYSKIEPDHDILELLAEHFSDRYKNDPFIIHDLRRGKGLFAAGGHWYVKELSEKDIPSLADREKEYRKLWKKYFETIAIEERKNPRCQKNFMPVRYWKNLTEMHETR